MAATRFDLVILDYDGTLADTRAAIVHCLDRAFAAHGRARPEPEKLPPVVGMGLSLPETCIRLDPDLRRAPSPLDAIIATYRALYRSEGEPLIVMFPGAAPTLRRLHDNGVACAVVSNKGAAAVSHWLNRHGFGPLIAAVFAEQQGRPNKPDPALLAEHIRPRFPGVSTGRMLMVGDTEIDIGFAKRAGIAGCWAAYGFGDPARCAALKPDYRIESIGELAGVVGLPAEREVAPRPA